MALSIKDLEKKLNSITGELIPEKGYISYIDVFQFVENSRAQENPFYLGSWRSNVQMTLASMNSVSEIPDAAVTLYRDNFFGRLVNKLTSDSFTSYFIDQQPEVLSFVDADVNVVSENKNK